jgi:nucleotide-binding universal stress UspA family protein
MIALHRILCPVDFSEASRHAFDHARALARQQRGVLTVLHLMPAPVLVGAGAPGPSGAVLAGVDAEEQRREDLRRFAGPDQAGDARLELRIEYGEGAGEILRQAAATRADMIVTTSVLRKATLPLLAVTPRCRRVPPAAFQRIVCGLDLSPSSAAALQYAVAMAGDSPEACLTLVHVLEGFPHQEVAAGQAGADLGLYWRYREGHARASLGELATSRAGACQTEVIVSSGNPWLEILDVAVERSADLIVVGAHGDAPAGHLGGTADRLARESACPVLVVPR